MVGRGRRKRNGNEKGRISRRERLKEKTTIIKNSRRETDNQREQLYL